MRAQLNYKMYVHITWLRTLLQHFATYCWTNMDFYIDSQYSQFQLSVTKKKLFSEQMVILFFTVYISFHFMLDNQLMKPYLRVSSTKTIT